MKNNYFIERLIQMSEHNEILLHENGKSYSSRALYLDSIELANGLSISGMKAGDTAIIASRPGLEFLKIIFATLMLEVKVAIIDPDMGYENYLSKVNQLNPEWAFMDYGVLLLQEHPILRYFYLRQNPQTPFFPSSSKMKRIATGSWKPIIRKHLKLKNLYAKSTNNRLEKQTQGKDFDYIVTYTSGSLSVPKGVVHSVKTISQSLRFIVNLLKDPKNINIATHLPHFMLIGVFAGMKVHLWNSDLDPKSRLAFLEKNNISTLFTPPGELVGMINYCKKNNTTFPDCVKHLLLGSAPIHVPFLKKLVSVISDDTQITCLYGMTEHLVVATCDGREKIKYQTQGDLLGKIAPGVDVKISENCEILISSNQLFKRYVHIDRTEEYHKTGDLGFINQEGLLVLKGRKKNMIIRKDFNLYPSLYEPTIKKIDGIEEAVYVGVYDEEIADEVVYLAIESKKDLDKSAIIKKLRSGNSKIDTEALPDKIVFTEIPRKGRQMKVDFNLLNKLIKEKYA